jgi:hypothetical protein
MLADGQDPRSPSGRRVPASDRPVGDVPMLIANVLRSFVAALGRPIFATAITASAIDRQRARQLRLRVRQSRRARARARRLGAGERADRAVHRCGLCRAIAATAAAPLPHVRRWWRPDWSGFARSSGSARRSCGHHHAEAGLFSGAAFLMGRIGRGAARRAHGRAADRRARLPGAVRRRPGGDDPRRLSLRRAATATAIGRAGWTALAMGAASCADRERDAVRARALILRIYIDPTRGQCGDGRLRGAIHDRGGGVPAVRRGPGGRGGRAARNAGHPRADVDRAVRLLGAGSRNRRGLGFFTPLAGHRHVDRAGRRAGGGGRLADHGAGPRRDGSGLRLPAHA